MTIEDEKASHYQKTEADYKKVLKYLEFLRAIYGDNAKFICGYEAGCLGFTLYHQLTSQHVECIILAPTTMLEQCSKKRIKTDKRDAEIIAKCWLNITTVLFTSLQQQMRKRKNFSV